ncbi:MAG: 30S ribosomal protein S9, partial [Propioniciclava sp.]
MTDNATEEVLDETATFTDGENREIMYRAEGTPSSATPGVRPAVVPPGAATGRRKEAIARVRLVPGTGEFKINGRT